MNLVFLLLHLQTVQFSLLIVQRLLISEGEPYLMANSEHQASQGKAKKQKDHLYPGG